MGKVHSDMTTIIRGHGRGGVLLVGFAVLVLASALKGNAEEPPAPLFGGRPSPSIERELDQLRRQGEVDALTRRRLADELRRSSDGAERRQGERALDALPGAGGPGTGVPGARGQERGAGDAGREPASRGLPPSRLPSTIPRGFGTTPRGLSGSER